jgi:uncharacterized protein (TIGR02996 family)
VYGHEPFIAVIEGNPDDDTPRLIYADWLDERADPRGEYLRAEVRLAKLPAGDPTAPDLRRRLRGLRGRIDPDWLARFDRPRVLRANPTPFPAAWWGIELPGVREFDDTYRRVRYESLPPLPAGRLRGDFGWLMDAPIRETASDFPALSPPTAGKLASRAGDHDLALPPEFLPFLCDLDLTSRIRSCTDCEFNLSGLLPVPGCRGDFLIRFYSDSQDCLHWYLYLAPGGYHAVVVSPQRVRRPRKPAPGRLPGRRSLRRFPAWFCAPTFEALLYRWWLEDEIWHASHDRTPLTPEQQAYLDFYREHPATPEPGRTRGTGPRRDLSRFRRSNRLLPESVPGSSVEWAVPPRRSLPPGDPVGVPPAVW